MGKGLLNKLVLQNLFEDISGKELLESLVASGVITKQDIEEYLTIHSTIKDGVLVEFDKRDLDSEGKYVTPKGVTIIGQNAFNTYSEYLNSIEFTDVVEIQKYAFARCYNLKRVYMNDKVRKIGVYAFLCCSNLADINISSNIQNIERGTFAGCYKLEQIELPKNLKRIEFVAFANCENLTSISNPQQSLEYVDKDAFSLTPIQHDFMRKFEENRKLVEQSNGVAK